MRIAALLRATAFACYAARALAARARADAAPLDLPASGDGGLFDQICQDKK